MAKHKTGEIVGNYQILSKIAEGGFGTTYKAQHIILETPVCIKIANKSSEEYEKLLIEEAQAIWELRHFGIPSIKDIIKLEDEKMALIMSYIPGPTLEKIVRKTKGLEPEHVAWVTERALNVLKYLHFHGVVHGDVKPGNIIVQPEDHTVVLVDYGLALVKPSFDTENKGRTPIFCSPEQREGKTLLPESDFYSLAKTMIYSLGGDIEKNTVPENVPNSLYKFIKRMLVYDLESRPNWEKEDLIEKLGEIRIKEFGRRNSGMKPIPGLENWNENHQQEE